MTTEGDFIVHNGGSVVGLWPVTDRGREWWNANVQPAERWQVRDGWTYLEHRAARAIVDAMRADGMTIANG